MMEQLDYLIRTLTYKRSCIECDLHTLDDSRLINSTEYMEGQIAGLTSALSELYKMLNEIDKDNE